MNRDFIDRYLQAHNKCIGVICDFDKNNIEYNHQFFLCDENMSDSTAWDLEIRRMENVIVYETNLDDAITLGLKSLDDFFNYPL